MSNEKTEYQETMLRHIGKILGMSIVREISEVKPSFQEFIAGGRFRCKFQGMFLPAKNRKGRYGITLTKKQVRFLNNLKRVDVALEVYNSDRYMKDGYRSGFEGLTVIIPRNQGEVLVKRQRTAKQTKFIRDMKAFGDSLCLENGQEKYSSKETLMAPEFTGFNKRDHDDKNLYVVWKTEYFIWNKDEPDLEKEYEKAQDYTSRNSDFLMSLLLDWCEEQGAEVIFTERDQKLARGVGSSYGDKLIVKISP